MDSIDAQSLPREDTTASPDQTQEDVAGRGRRVHPLLADIDPAGDRNQAVLIDWLSDSKLLRQPPTPRVVIDSIMIASHSLKFNLLDMVVYYSPAHRQCSLQNRGFPVSIAAPGNATVDVPAYRVPNLMLANLNPCSFVDIYFPGLAGKGKGARGKVDHDDAELFWNRLVLPALRHAVGPVYGLEVPPMACMACQMNCENRHGIYLDVDKVNAAVDHMRRAVDADMAEAAAEGRASALAGYKDFFFITSFSGYGVVTYSGCWKDTVKKTTDRMSSKFDWPALERTDKDIITVLIS